MSDLCRPAFVLQSCDSPDVVLPHVCQWRVCYFCIPHDKGNGRNFSPSKDREIDDGWWGRKGVQQKRMGGKWDALRRKRREKKSIHAPRPSSVSSIVPPLTDRSRVFKRRGRVQYPNLFPTGDVVKRKSGFNEISCVRMDPVGRARPDSWPDPRPNLHHTHTLTYQTYTSEDKWHVTYYQYFYFQLLCFLAFLLDTFHNHRFVAVLIHSPHRSQKGWDAVENMNGRMENGKEFHFQCPQFPNPDRLLFKE